MSWLTIVIIAYLFLALVNLIDKFLLDNVLGNPKVYAFLISVLGSVVILAAPWFLIWPGWFLFTWQIVVGALFPIALILMFAALKHGDASKITVLIGGVIPIFTIIFSYLFFQERFTMSQWGGIAFLLIGTFVIALISGNKTGDVEKQNKNNRAAFWLSFFSALAYALFFVGTKYAYNHHDFFSSFIWIRIGSLFLALLLLVGRTSRREILGSLKSGQPSGTNRNRFIIIGNQALGAVAFVLQNYAISFGSVALVNALQGVQYAFLLIFGWLFTIFNPKIIKENLSRRVVLQKIAAIILITIGLYFIAI